MRGPEAEGHRASPNRSIGPILAALGRGHGPRPGRTKDDALAQLKIFHNTQYAMRSDYGLQINALEISRIRNCANWSTGHNS